MKKAIIGACLAGVCVCVAGGNFVKVVGVVHGEEIVTNTLAWEGPEGQLYSGYFAKNGRFVFTGSNVWKPGVSTVPLEDITQRGLKVIPEAGRIQIHGGGSVVTNKCLVVDYPEGPYYVHAFTNGEDEVFAKVLDETIKALGESGRICEVYGHVWRGGRPGEGGGHFFLDYHPNTSYRTCRICGKCESMSKEWK